MSEAKPEMVERVARALFETEWSPAAARHEGKTRLDWEKEWPGSREYWLNSARAAIAAMREPTESMTEAAYALPAMSIGNALLAAGYRAMVDEALK